MGHANTKSESEPRLGLGKSDWSKDTAKVREDILLLVSAEQPIAVDYLQRRLASVHGLSNNKTLRGLLADQVDALVATGRLHQSADWLWITAEAEKRFDGFRYLPVGTERLREANHIYPQEIANAAESIIVESLSIGESALLQELRLVFGFGSMGSNIKVALEKGLENLSDSLHVRVENERWSKI